MYLKYNGILRAILSTDPADVEDNLFPTTIMLIVSGILKLSSIAKMPDSGMYKELRMHLGVEVTESSTNKQHHLSQVTVVCARTNTCRSEFRCMLLGACMLVCVIFIESHVLHIKPFSGSLSFYYRRRCLARSLGYGTSA